MPRIPWTSSLALAALTPCVLATAQESERSWLEVDGSSAIVQSETGPPAGPPQPTGPVLVSGLLWTHDDAGLGWIGTSASIGNCATQVFAEYDLNQEAAELFSVFDAHPPSAVWSDAAALGSEYRAVASADSQDVHVALHQIVIGGTFTTRQAVLSCYRSSSAVPVWSFTFAPVIDGASRVSISRDGERILAAIEDKAAQLIEIAAFAPGSAVPLFDIGVPALATEPLHGFDLSADGSTLYFTAGTTGYVLDVASAQVVFNTDVGAMLDAHAISGDGSLLAFGGFNRVDLWKRSGATYVQYFTRSIPGPNFVSRIDVSDDGSTVAYGLTYYDTYSKVRIETLDVPTKLVTMSDVAIGAGVSQNIVSDLVLSADGSRIAVGLWGDDAGLVPELRFYAKYQGVPLATVDLPGSIFDVDLSPDGTRMVAASKAVHANTPGNGGRIDLFDAGSDFILRGIPTLGASLHFELTGPPGATAFLLRSALPSSPPSVFPGAGTLYIDRDFTPMPIGVVPAGGIASRAWTVPSDPAWLGQSLYFQGLMCSPRTLTQSWAKVTMLP